MENEKEFSNEFVKYIFSEQEKREIAAEMAQKVSELSQAEDEKKAIMSDFKSRIDGLQAEVNRAATRINNGYEMRNIKCEVVADFERRMYFYYRVDNDELVKEKKMNSEDLQMNLI